MIATPTDITVAIISAAAVIVAAVLAFIANFRTRRQNAVEHKAGSVERQVLHEMTMEAIGNLRGDVGGLAQRLDDHTNMLVHHVTDVSVHNFG